MLKDNVLPGQRLHLLLGALFLIAACGNAPDHPMLDHPQASHLLLITVDGLGADRLSAVNQSGAKKSGISRLQNPGLTFHEVVSPSHQPLEAYQILLWNRPGKEIPKEPGDPALAPALSWPERMRQEGFSTYALVSADPLHSRTGLNQGFDEFNDSLDFSRAINDPDVRIPAQTVVQRAKIWLNQRQGSAPFFAWLHFSDLTDPSLDDARFEIVFSKLDGALGNLFEAMDSLGLMDSTLILLTSPHGRWDDPAEPSKAKRPLIIHHPKLFTQPQHQRLPVCLADVYPSVLSLYNFLSPPGLLRQSIWAKLAQGTDDATDSPPSDCLADEPAAKPQDPLLDPPKSLDLLLLADEFTEQGRKADARIRLQLVLDLEPRNRALQLRISRSLIRLGQTQPARDILITILKDPYLPHEPAGKILRRETAQLLQILGEVEAAETLILEGISSRDADHSPWFELSRFYLETGQTPKAGDALNHILDEDPQNTAAICALGQVELALFQDRRDTAHLDNADQYFNRSLEKDPGLAAAWNGLGLVRLFRLDSSQAEYFWRKALVADPAFAEVYFHLGRLLIRSGRPNEARRLLLTARKLGLGDSDAHQLDALQKENLK